MVLDTLRASDAWNIQAEWTALDSLSKLIAPRQFQQYVLTGTFLEHSKRSNVHYMFRKSRPTVALGTTRDGGLKILACLCLHPIGHYAGSFAGCLVPTDDVIAHVTLMRGDEHKFWGKANQHPSYALESGI